ncbi:lysis protein [Xenorhabdus cabanillasii]|uniref:Similar to cryptic prophage endopeptidase b1362 n=1 Tax=Xenorhabdus cabanillasii JM26 TaxID=1427517 RepID=W1IWU2_9GAMM|nr:lysis protein [Xenorhabdus cabanillasii]PHM77178.1 lysis protein [Xenorhabdus cabanillasii JM26]CDL81695.1 Similar to cryptic prophage endopeptidase b1362 [Xenorhabdus cabanillasii JM26]
MKLNFTNGTVIALIIASVAALLYRSGYKKQLGINSDQITEIQQLTDTINYQNAHIAMLHELDSKHTQELANAKTEINKLRDAAHAHPERVYIKAKCPMSKTIVSSGMDDAVTARPTDTAIRNYWLLRERIATSEQMILGLQGYIRTQCQ